MTLQGYGISISMFNLSWTQKEKFHIFKQSCTNLFIIRVVVKCRLPAKFTRGIWGDHWLDFGSWLYRMKRETNDSGVNHFLSFDWTYCRTEKNSIMWFPTTSRFGGSMISKAIQIKYRFGCLFHIFSFSSSLRQNFVFWGLVARQSRCC